MDYDDLFSEIQRLPHLQSQNVLRRLVWHHSEDATKLFTEEKTRLAKRRSELAKAVTSARKEGWIFTLKNGLPVTLLHTSNPKLAPVKTAVDKLYPDSALTNHYVILVQIAGHKIYFILKNLSISDQLFTLRELNIYSSGVHCIVYGNVAYTSCARHGALLIRSVKERTSPSITVLLTK